MLTILTSINSHILIYMAKCFTYRINHVCNEPHSGNVTGKPLFLFLLSAAKFKVRLEVELLRPSSTRCGSPKYIGHPNVAPCGENKGLLGQKLSATWYCPW